MSVGALLGPAEPPCYRVAHESGRSPFVLACDHAGNRLPRTLGNLGLNQTELASHIAWDLGIAGLAEKLAHMLDAFLILQTYSRLVIDVNRPVGSPESIVTRSERTDISGNLALTTRAKDARATALFWPYHRRLRSEIDARLARAQPTMLIALHSFTPVFLGAARDVEIAVLYGRDERLARALLTQLRAEGTHRIGENEPYAVSDDTDYTLLVHGEQRGIPHVELELRNDLLSDEAGQRRLAERLARALVHAASVLFPT